MLRVLKQLILTTILAVFAMQASAMFIQPDWLNPTEPGVGTNRYAYSQNDPINRRDPGGNAAETVWDVFNVLLDAFSFSSNMALGNYGGAVVDAGGIVIDGAATILPGVPGGAGSAIRVGRIAKAGYAVKKSSANLAKVATSGKYAQTISSAARKMGNSLNGLKTDDILGAVKESMGMVVKDRNGKVRDHITEVTQEISNLRTQAAKLEKVINGGKLASDQVDAVQSAIDAATRHADMVEKTLEIARKAAEKAKDALD